MIKILKYAACCSAVLAMMACGDLYETHEKYLKMGEETYIGRVDTLFANGGFKRIELGWSLNADPKISSCVITWSGSTEPIVVAADRSEKYMKKVINLPEGKYIFTIVIKSESGKESLAQTVSGEVYGDSYQSRLVQRGINSIVETPGGAKITFVPEDGCLGTDLKYTDKDGLKQTVTISEDQSFVFVENFVSESDFTISSLYKPELNGIDQIRSSEKTYKFPSTSSPYYIVSKGDWTNIYHKNYVDVVRDGWTAEATSEEKVGEGEVNGHVEALLDGDLGTFWHSKYQGSPIPALPHLITLDMKNRQDIMSVELARRSGNKDTKKVVFSISDDKDNWTEIGELVFVSGDPDAKVLLLKKAVNGQYLRAAVKESNNGNVASIAEIFFTSGKK